MLAYLRLKGFAENQVADRSLTRPGASRVKYAVRELFYTLQGEGATPAGQRYSAGSPGATYGPGRRRIRATAICASVTPTSSDRRTGGGLFCSADTRWQALWQPRGQPR